MVLTRVTFIFVAVDSWAPAAVDRGTAAMPAPMPAAAMPQL